MTCFRLATLHKKENYLKKRIALIDETIQRTEITKYNLFILKMSLEVDLMEIQEDIQERMDEVCGE